MSEEKKLRIAKIHICSFENFDEKFLQRDLQIYPERLCIIDENNDIVIDVNTKHKYTYIRTINMLYFKNEKEKNKVVIGKRFGCFEYDPLALSNISSKELKQCKEIINLLNEGYIFLDGNEELTNEQYLELINCSKKEEQPKKMFKKRK